MIRVLVADDSRSARILLVSLLGADPEIEVVGEAEDGAAALAMTKRLRPDVITMDIQMPGMDGLEATERIMNETPTPIVVVSSAVSARDVASSFRATQAGALTALPKPGAATDATSEEDRRAFVSTVKAMARVKVVRRWGEAPSRAAGLGGPPRSQDVAFPPLDPHRSPALGTRSSPAPTRRASVIAIAASTGGPPALQRVLFALPRTFPAPILLVQHMANGFLAGFAAWLADECDLRVKVAEAGEPLVRGTVYLAPEGAHLGLTIDRKVRHIQDPPVNGFCPSASVMFESAAESVGNSLIAVILTGMGSDGVSGLRRVRAIGGYVVAQDEATSVVYGMPAEAVRAGLVDLSLPVDRIGPRLRMLAER